MINTDKNKLINIHLSSLNTSLKEINKPFRTCTVTDVLAMSVSEQVYFPESEVCALAMNSLLFAPFVNISVFTLKKRRKLQLKSTIKDLITSRIIKIAQNCYRIPNDLFLNCAYVYCFLNNFLNYQF